MGEMSELGGRSLAKFDESSVRGEMGDLKGISVSCISPDLIRGRGERFGPPLLAVAVVLLREGVR